MASKDKRSAEPFLPEQRSLETLRGAVQECQGCDLYQNATQAVFGEGPKDATLILVGEQPGDEEDKLGHPFIGPAGRLLDKVLEEVGIPRDDVYVTNAVKHFKWEPRGKRRMHSKPRAGEVRACKPWLEAELTVVDPQILVLLGATAAQSLLGTKFRVTQHRGEPLSTPHAAVTFVTVHPSSVLRAPTSEARQEAREALLADFGVIAEHYRQCEER